MERLPSYGPCFFCGRRNPQGIKLEVFAEGEEVWSEFQLSETFTGYEGRIHGGMLAGVLDEVMWWAVAWRTGRACLTVEMTVRYKRPTPVKRRYRARARAVEVSSKIAIAEGEIEDLAEGRVCSTAKGRYYLLSGRSNQEALALLDYTACSPAVRARFLQEVEEPTTEAH